MTKKITKLVWYDSKDQYIEIDYIHKLWVRMRKKDMKKLALELGIEMEMRHKR